MWRSLQYHVVRLFLFNVFFSLDYLDEKLEDIFNKSMDDIYIEKY